MHAGEDRSRLDVMGGQEVREFVSLDLIGDKKAEKPFRAFGLSWTGLESDGQILKAGSIETGDDPFPLEKTGQPFELGKT